MTAILFGASGDLRSRRWSRTSGYEMTAAAIAGVGEYTER